MVTELATLTLVPVWWYLSILFMFGAIIGSFLNVYIYRFHTGKSLNGRSHCMSCGTPLTWYELVPVLSYLGLRGRCRTCRSRITPRYALVEVLTGGLFLACGLVAVTAAELLFLLPFITILVVVTVYDYYHFIIPDELTLALTVVVSGFVGYQWWSGQVTTLDIGWMVGATGGAVLFFYSLWAVSRGQWLGFGDVKLAVPLGLWVGTTGVFSFVVLSFWVGAALSVLILLIQRYRGQPRLHPGQQTLTMKSAVPFAPFMIIGAGLVYFLHINVLSLFSFI